MSKTETIEIEVDKVHALVIKEYEGMVIDIFTKKPVERFMKPITGYRVSKVTIQLEKLNDQKKPNRTKNNSRQTTVRKNRRTGNSRGRSSKTSN